MLLNPLFKFNLIEQSIRMPLKEVQKENPLKFMGFKGFLADFPVFKALWNFGFMDFLGLFIIPRTGYS